MKGLKPWAKNDLMRRKVTNVDSAIAAIEILENYFNLPSKRKFNPPVGQDNCPSKWGKAQSGGVSQFNYNAGGVERRNWGESVNSKPSF